MKKILILTAALCMSLLVLFVGCKKTDVGIIGGADGPTNIIVSDNNQKYNSKKEPVRVLMADGYLYYDTGEDSDMSGRCGTLDGSFKKKVDVWELPKKNNTSNFETKNKNYCGYQYGFIENTIEVPIDDDWEIFKKLYDPEKDVTQYKYIVKVEGKTEYRQGESEFVVLTNNLDITANDVAKSMFSSDSNDHLDIYIVAIDLD